MSLDTMTVYDAWTWFLNLPVWQGALLALGIIVGCFFLCVFLLALVAYILLEPK